MPFLKGLCVLQIIYLKAYLGRAYPVGVDADDADDVEESRHLGVVAFAGDWLLLAGEGLLVVADGELFNVALPDEGAPRYLGGKTISGLYPCDLQLVVVDLIRVVAC